MSKDVLSKTYRHARWRKRKAEKKTAKKDDKQKSSGKGE